MFLFEKYEFRFVDSLYSKSFGGDAYVTIESENMKMRFTLDRGQLLLEFASRKRQKSKWYSIDLISQLVTGKVETTALLDDHYAQFLVESIEEILNLFSEKNLERTLQELSKLEKARAKRLFG
jgi:hypothetical protein